MKIESVVRARSIWLFHSNDLNPYGLSLQKLIPGLLERYRFVVAPSPKEALEAKEGIHFRSGTFSKPDGTEIVVDLISYRDGVIADTRSSTEDSDRFLADLLGWTSSEFGLRPIAEIKVRKIYISEMFVTCDRPLERLNPKMRKFADAIAQYLPERGSPRFELSHIQFSVNPPTTPNQPASFRFELAEPRAEGRYYTFAPLTSADHIKLLENLYSVLE